MLFAASSSTAYSSSISPLLLTWIFCLGTISLIGCVVGVLIAARSAPPPYFARLYATQHVSVCGTFESLLHQHPEVLILRDVQLLRSVTKKRSTHRALRGPVELLSVVMDDRERYRVALPPGFSMGSREMLWNSGLTVLRIEVEKRPGQPDRVVVHDDSGATISTEDQAHDK